jgi:hypothetical protein
MTLDRDQRRGFLARLIGWPDERAVDIALGYLPRDVAALVVQGCPCSTSKVAAFLWNEVAVDRASDSHALEAHRKEDSHGPCCHRSGWQGIPDLHPSLGRNNHRRAEGPQRASSPSWLRRGHRAGS